MSAAMVISTGERTMTRSTAAARSKATMAEKPISESRGIDVGNVNQLLVFVHKPSAEHVFEISNVRRWAMACAVCLYRRPMPA